MKLSKGHFEELARALALSRPEPDGTRAQEWRLGQWQADVDAIQQVCHDLSNFTPNGNRAFDRDRFRKATRWSP